MTKKGKKKKNIPNISVEPLVANHYLSATNVGVTVIIVFLPLLQKLPLR